MSDDELNNELTDADDIETQDDAPEKSRQSGGLLGAALTIIVSIAIVAAGADGETGPLVVHLGYRHFELRRRPTCRR